MTEKLKPVFEEIVNEEEFLVNLRPAKSTSVSRDLGEAGILSIINSKGNGKRVSLSAQLLENIENPEHVQIGFTHTELVVGEIIPDSIGVFKVKEFRNKGMLYAGGLVEEITSEFSLNFSDRTSLTFHVVTYRIFRGKPIAFIKILDAVRTD